MTRFEQANGEFDSRLLVADAMATALGPRLGAARRLVQSGDRPAAERKRA